MVEKLGKIDKPERDFDGLDYDFSIIIVTFESRFFEYFLFPLNEVKVLNNS